MGNGTITMTGAEYDALASKVATLEAELVRTAAQRDAILQQARAWAGEAKTQRSTVLEVGEILGGIPDWGPISAGVEAMAAENAKLRAELERRAADEPTQEEKDAAANRYLSSVKAAPSAPKADPVKVQLLEALRKIVATPFNCREKSAVAMCDIASAAIAAARQEGKV